LTQAGVLAALRDGCDLMDTEDEPVDIVSGGEAKEMDKEAESILKDWSQEKEIPSLQGRLAESWRLVDRWNLERANPESILKGNVLAWSMSAFLDEVFGANWVSRIPTQVSIHCVDIILNVGICWFTYTVCMCRILSLGRLALRTR
jgi:hypothetical protein